MSNSCEDLRFSHKQVQAEALCPRSWSLAPVIIRSARRWIDSLCILHIWPSDRFTALQKLVGQAVGKIFILMNGTITFNPRSHRTDFDATLRDATWRVWCERSLGLIWRVVPHQRALMPRARCERGFTRSAFNLEPSIIITQRQQQYFIKASIISCSFSSSSLWMRSLVKSDDLSLKKWF